MDKAIVLFDGYCNFCSRSVNFIIDHDKEAHFVFTSLQLEQGQEILRRHGLNTDDLDSFVVIDEGKAYIRSSAALRIVRKLGWPWKLAYAFIIIPRPLRDLAYKLFARNRYRLFGKRRQCRIPTPEERARFL